MLVGCTSGLAPADTGDAGQELLGIGLSPNGPIARVGEQLPFTAKAFYADTTNEVINDQVTWVVTEPRVAEIDASGVATVLAAGVTDIVAAAPNGASAKVQLTAKASDVFPTGIVLAPGILALTVGEVIEVEAIAEFTDGSAGNVSARCTFTSDAPGVVAMNGPEARGVAAGDTTVRADCDGLHASATAHVTAAGGVGRPDLRVTDWTVEVNDHIVEVLVEIENAGDANASGFYLDLFLDPAAPPVVGDPFDETVYVSGVGAGQTKLLHETFGEVAVGNHSVWAFVDADDWIDEDDEGNNQAGPWQANVVDVAANGPQLEIRTFEAASDGSSTLYEVRIENTGQQAATDFFVDLWFDRPGTPSSCEYGDTYLWVGAIAPGESLLWQPEVDDGPSSWWDSVVFVDSCDDVAESDEQDNVAKLAVWPE